jgi:hypothetical protein
MMTNTTQVVDLRTKGPLLQFATSEAEASYNESMRRFRESIPASVKYVVAPGASITVRDGSVRSAGQAIDPTDLPEQAGRASWRVFDDYVWDGRVIENLAFVPPDDTP